MNVYPVDKPSNTGTLPVSPLHTIAFSDYGNPAGKPAVYLHGGAGFFDPNCYRIVLFDQRGCGRSRHMPIYAQTPLGI